MSRICAVLVAVSLLIVSSCTEESEVSSPAVVVVGEQSITLEELQRAFDGAATRGEEYHRDSLSARQFLKDYIDKTLLEQIAADSIPWLPIFAHRVESFLESHMVQKLRQDTYGEAVDIGEDDLRAVYDRAETRYHYRMIPFPSEAEALRTLHVIREGAHFVKVAERVTGQSDGGDMGWQSSLEAPEAIIAALAKMSPGDVSAAIEHGLTFYLLQLLEKEPNPDRPSFDEVRGGLRMRLIQERGGRLLAQFHRHLFEKYRFQPRMDQVLWMTGFLREETRDVQREVSMEDMRGPDGQLTGELPSERPWTENPLAEEDWDRILATTTVDTISAILLLDHLANKLTFTWPTFETPDDVMALIRELVRSRLERAEAWDLGYDKDPELVWRAQKQRGLVHTRQFYLRKVRAVTRASMEEAREWYEAQAEEMPGRRRYVLYVVADWDAALAAREVLAREADPARAFTEIQRIDADATWLGENGLTVSEDRVSNPMDRQIFRLELGGITDPVPVGNRFGVARVEEIEPVRTVPFERVAEPIIEQLSQARADSLLNVYISERRAVTPIEIREEIFAQLRWEPPVS